MKLIIKKNKFNSLYIYIYIVISTLKQNAINETIHFIIYRLAN